VPPAIALLVWSILLLVLIRYHSRKDSTPSLALWIPVIWMFFISSRSPSQWFGLTPMTAATAFMEGSGLDRGIFLALMGLAIGALATRQLNWSGLVARNTAVTLFLLFALVSVTWSDFPLITFKRWVRDLGTYLMVVLVLSHPRPLDAISTVIRRSSYLLLFLSIVLIKYYPEIGVSYNSWSGAPEYAGATTSKNMLGAVCLISGIFYFWDTLRRWPERRTPGTKPSLLVNIALIAMTLWLLRLSNSATSQGCLVIGCVVVALLQGKWAMAHPRVATAVIPVTLSAYVALEFAFDLSTIIADFLGRDATLHGRTGIWDVLLAVQTNPLIGVGYQSFWLGERLTTVWRSLNVDFLNEAHNGYLEIYLSLGIIGLALLVMIMVSSYWRISRQLAVSPSFAALGLSLWSIMIVYNLTEAAFGASPLWTVFLLCGIGVPLSKAKMPARKAEEVLNSRRGVQFQRQTGMAAHGRVPPRRTRQAHFSGARGVQSTTATSTGSSTVNRGATKLPRTTLL
jgi:exopolysaccharide production protein ExoQ